jgi:hypothetical protein
MKNYIIIGLAAVFVILLLVLMKPKSSSDEVKNSKVAKQNPPVKNPPQKESHGSEKKIARETANAKAATGTALTQYLKSADPRAEWFLNPSPDGQIIAISGGMIHEKLDNRENSLAFGKKMAGFLGINPDQIALADSNLPSTDDTHSVRFQQKIEDYNIWGAEMNVFIRNKDESIYFITNEARPISDVDLRINHEIGEAQIAVRRLFPNRGIKIISSAEKPVVIPTGSSQGKLCWQIEVTLNQPRLERKVLFLSVQDLSLVRSDNLQIRN